MTKTGSYLLESLLTSGLPLTPMSGKRTVSLFSPTKRMPITPTKTPASSPSAPTNTIFTRAKAVLRRGTIPGKLTARSSERSQILSFLSHQLGKVKRGAFLYICGPPGTGKTALMHEIYSEYQECESNSKTDMAFINCMSLERAEEVFDRIIETFNGDVSFIDAQLESLFIKRKTMTYVHSISTTYNRLVVLDEMDHLLTKNQEVMYKLVEYANRPGSKLVLIGIANSLNLPDRFLPRLKSKTLEPKRLSFNPYTTEDIVAIISARLQSLDPESSTLPLMDPKAIELCARKVSAASGDLRMALDMCRKAVELVETEELARLESEAKRPLQETNLQTPSPSPSKRRRMAATMQVTQLSVETAPKAGLSHIINVTKNLSSSHVFQQRIKAIPTPHKAILTALEVLKDTNVTPTLGDLCDKYVKLCRRDGLVDPLPKGEFIDACKQLQVGEYITIEKATGSKIIDRTSRVGLRVQKEDISQAIKGYEGLEAFFR
jgi:cell division control protein 6